MTTLDMNRYWISRNGATEGPFAEAHLQGLWERGELMDEHQLCLEHTEDWRAAGEVMREIQAAARQESGRAASRQRLEAFRAEAEGRLKKERKSSAVAFLTSFVLPGLGHAYCGSWLAAALLMALGVGLVSVLGPLSWLVVGLLAGTLGIVAVKRYNARLATDLGL